MGTMVNLFVGIRQAPPLIDTFIVPEVPGVLYALFDYGLTFGLFNFRVLVRFVHSAAIRFINSYIQMSLTTSGEMCSEG